MSYFRTLGIFYEYQTVTGTTTTTTLLTMATNQVIKAIATPTSLLISEVLLLESVLTHCFTGIDPTLLEIPRGLIARPIHPPSPSAIS